jgi:hypothetical protein
MRQASHMTDGNINKEAGRQRKDVQVPYVINTRRGTELMPVFLDLLKCLSCYYFNKLLRQLVCVSVCFQLVMKVSSTNETFGHFGVAVKFVRQQVLISCRDTTNA